MTTDEQRIYDAAVEFVESHGGIVFDPHEKHASIIAKIEANLSEEEDPSDLEIRKDEALNDFTKMLGRKNFSYSAVEDMMLGHGLEMDYIEDFIHQM